jgi:uncharacterized membrane protein SpoIIM required for sporulation
MDESADMRRWITTRAVLWRGLLQKVELLRSHQRATVDESLSALDAYRTLARDLATARRVAPGSRTAAGLESLYVQLHSLINRTPRNVGASVLTLLRIDIPRAARELRGRILSMGLLMAAMALAGWWLVSAYPTLISLFASEGMIEQVEQGHLWTESMLNIMPASVLSVSIFANNIVVSILAFCMGIFFGLGTLYLIGFNGLMLGAAFAFVHQHQLAGALFKFIIAHGPVELSVICIAGACGVALGESLIRPTAPSRRDSFEACAHRVGPLVLLCAALLIGCGFIEGFVSPDPAFPLASRMVIGVCYWLVMCGLMSGRVFRVTPASASET